MAMSHAASSAAWNVRGTCEIVLTRDGQDDEKPAVLRRVIIRDKDELTGRMKVKRGEGGQPFLRNEYVLTKQ
jgi:hypothetical protein